MIDNKVTAITTFFLFFSNISLSGMQQSNNNLIRNLRSALAMQETQAANQRWILTFRTTDFDAVTKAVDDVQIHAKDHFIDVSIDCAGKTTTEISFILKGPKKKLVEKLEKQKWFDQNNLHEEQEQRK